MTNYTRDGGIIPSGIPISKKKQRSDQHKFMSLKIGQIVSIVYPDDPKSTSKKRIEYIVEIDGQDYLNCVDARNGGGINNYYEKVKKDSTYSSTGELGPSTFNEQIDGELVYVLFLDGDGDIPIIIGSAQHPLTEHKPKKEDGIFSIERFNGIEFFIDKDGNFSLSQVGIKNNKGEVQNPDGVGSKISLYSNGNIEMNASTVDENGDVQTELKMNFTKSTGKFEVAASGNTATMDANGIVINDANSNSVSLNSSKIDIVSASDADITATGDHNISAVNINMNGSGNLIIKGDGGTEIGDSSAVTKVNGSTVQLAGGGPPVARLGDQTMGIGNLGAPVMGTIIAGSPKVQSG